MTTKRHEEEALAFLAEHDGIVGDDEPAKVAAFAALIARCRAEGRAEGREQAAKVCRGRAAEWWLDTDICAQVARGCAEAIEAYREPEEHLDTKPVREALASRGIDPVSRSNAEEIERSAPRRSDEEHPDSSTGELAGED